MLARVHNVNICMCHSELTNKQKWKGQQWSFFLTVTKPLK